MQIALVIKIERVSVTGALNRDMLHSIAKKMRSALFVRIKIILVVTLSGMRNAHPTIIVVKTCNLSLIGVMQGLIITLDGNNTI